ncbi:MAG TPA: sulfurtransferase TusA family protein [Nitrososphaerales archaeon]|nr:sulfurtransferase TusA family protein [Nitrososphaerales archaeon]
MKISGCEFPDGLLYDVEQGTWADLKGDVIRVGITSLLSWSFGVFSGITFRNIGMALVRGQVMGTMEGSRHFDVFRSPVSGTLSAANERLIDEPWLLNKDPYGEAWFAEIRVKGTGELGALGRLPVAKHRIAVLLKERHVHCFAAFPDFEIFDTGVECQAVLAKLNELLERSTPGTVVHVVSDDSSAEIEMQRWSDQTGNSIVDLQREGKIFHYIVRKESSKG